LSREDFVALVEAAGQQQRLVEELANLGDQRKRAPGAGMSTRTGGNGNQAVDSRLVGFLRVSTGGDVMEDQPSVAVYGIHHFLHRTKTGDHDRNPLFDADREIGLQARVAVVNDEVYRIGCGGRLRCELFSDLLQPVTKATAFALIQGWKAAYHAIGTAGGDECRVGNQKHRCRHQGQA